MINLSQDSVFDIPAQEIYINTNKNTTIHLFKRKRKTDKQCKFESRMQKNVGGSVGVRGPLQGGGGGLGLEQ